MKPFLRVFLYVSLCIWVTGCKNKTPSTDPEENKFYSAYRDIYYAYKKIPIDSSRRDLEAYLSRFPENADAWAFYGNVCFKMRDYEGAKQAYLKAIHAEKGKGTFYSSLGTVYGAENKIDSAEKYLLKGVELRDSSGYTLLNLAMLYRHKNNEAEATKFADAAALKTDSSALVCAGLSYIYSELGEMQRSRVMAESAARFGLRDTAGLNDVLSRKITIEDFYRTNY